MKFGEALPQRSVPEWLSYNLDYNEIKQLIKRYTTGKPLVQVPELKTAFEDEFFDVFLDQLERIGLFVKCKAGEIDRRIIRCNRQVAPLCRDSTDGLTSRKANKYVKVEQEVERVSCDIQCLSRFVSVQHTGFLKLLKKYRKWTGSSHLTSRFMPVLEQPTSFHKVNFEKNVLELSNLLVVVRSGFDSLRLAAVTGQPNRPLKESPLKHSIILDSDNTQTFTAESHAYIDTALAMSSPATNGGGKATFWVHYDHLIEVQVLLMKYLTLQTTSPSSSIPSTPIGRRDSSHGSVWKDDETGVVVLDDLESFSDVQSTATIAEVSQAGPRTAGQVRWCSRDQDAVVVVSDASSSVLNGSGVHPGETLEVKLRRKHVQALLEEVMTSQSTNSNFEITDAEGQLALNKVQDWFRSHRNVTPLVKLLTKRTRFTDTPGGSPVWALLDWDIRMIKINKGMDWMNDPEEYDPGRGLRNGSMVEFPHAVLEVQWEGEQIPEFLRELERSYMVEPVRGFSLDVHAIAVLYRPAKMTAPFWVSALQKDIRKTPSHTPRHSRHSSSYLMFTQSSKNTSFGTTVHDFTDGGFDSSATLISGPDPTPGRRKFSRSKSGLSEIESIGGERYWSEFNDATDNEEEPYTILVNHKASSDDGYEDHTLGEFIKQGFISAGTKVHRFFVTNDEKRSERQPLLRKPSLASSESSGDVDMEAGILTNRSGSRGVRQRYTTFSQFEASRSMGKGYICCLAGSIAILILTVILALNSKLLKHKHKLRKGGFTLDLEVCGAVLTALTFAGTGLVMFMMRRQAAGMLHQAVVWLAFASVCIGSGVVFAIVGESEVGN